MGGTCGNYPSLNGRKEMVGNKGNLKVTERYGIEPIYLNGAITQWKMEEVQGVELKAVSEKS